MKNPFKLVNNYLTSLALDVQQASSLIPTTGSNLGWNVGDSAFSLNYITSQQLTSSGTLINGESMLRIAAVFDSVRMISEDIAKLPLNIKRNLPSGGTQIVNQLDPLYFRIARSPNKQITAQSYWETILAHALVWGNSYALIDRDEASGLVRSLQIVHPNNVKVVTVDGNIWYQVSAVDERGKIIPGAPPRMIDNMNMYHIHGVGDGITGWPIVNYALESLGLTLSVESYTSAFMGNGGHISGVLQTEGKPSKEIRKDMAESWAAKVSGPNNVGSIPILSDGLKYVPLSMKFTDAQVLETREFQIQEVARWFRIPLHKLAILSSNATFNNIEQENLKYVNETLGAWMIRLEKEIEFKLLPENSPMFVKFDTKSLTMGDSASRAEWNTKMFQMGSINPNEIRESEGLNPYEGGEVYYIPQNTGTVEEITARGAVTDLGSSEQQALDFETLKAKFDSYGVGVRAGAITPQTVDEDSFRSEAGLPTMGTDVKSAWEDDGGVRRPITLQSQETFSATGNITEAEAGANPSEEEPQQSFALMMKYKEVIVDSLQVVIDKEAKYRERTDKKKEGDKGWQSGEMFYSQQAEWILSKMAVHLNYMNMELPANYISKWCENTSMLNWQETKAEQMADDLILHYYQAQNSPDQIYIIQGRQVRKEGLKLSYV